MTDSVLPIPIAAPVAVATSVVQAQDRADCERALSKAIKDVGLSMGDIHTQLRGLESADNGAERWKFSGQPKSRHSGRLIASNESACAALRVYTMGECRLEGLARP